MLPALLLAACVSAPGDPLPVLGPLRGRVVELDGSPVEGAELRAWEDGAWGEPVESGPDGSFSLPASRNAWVRATVEGYLPSVRAASPDAPVLLRLSPDDGRLRLAFGGDVMAGRRFYQGAEGEPLLVHGLEAIALPGLLEGIAPLLSQARLASVNLETPLCSGGTAHPSKPYTYRSHPLLASALRQAGVGYANLANNHVYDYLEDGLAETLASLDAAGVAHAGAGPDEDAAWEPAVLELDGLRVAFLGCTTITGDDEALSYVADDAEAKGGAARCELDRIDEAVARARERAELVVFQVHGGWEYGEEPSVAVQNYTEEALRAGADLALGHHPHVFQGIENYSGSPVAWSLGNLLFDQQVWQTLPTGLLLVELSPEGEVLRARVEPLLLEDYLPRGVTGWLRQREARQLLALSPALLALDDGAVEVDLEGSSALQEAELQAEGGSRLVDLREGQVVRVEGQLPWRLGRDLLGVGDFEDLDVDGEVAEGSLWSLDSPGERVTEDAAHAGHYGLRLSRDAASASVLISSPLWRLPVEGGAELTFAGWYRSDGPAEVWLEWYAELSGQALSSVSLALEPSGDWAYFRLDAIAPAEATAVRPSLRLPQPSWGRVTADWDELRVVQWEAWGRVPDDAARCDLLESEGPAVVRLQRRVLPGADDF